MATQMLHVDPRTLHVPPSRSQGADPGKLARQISQFGLSTAGMPPVQVICGKDGKLRINDGVTRATHVAKLLPGQLLVVEIFRDLPHLDVGRFPTIGELLP